MCLRTYVYSASAPVCARFSSFEEDLEIFPVLEIGRFRREGPITKRTWHGPRISIHDFFSPSIVHKVNLQIRAIVLSRGRHEWKLKIHPRNLHTARNRFYLRLWNKWGLPRTYVLREGSLPTVSIEETDLKTKYWIISNRCFVSFHFLHMRSRYWYFMFFSLDW